MEPQPAPPSPLEKRRVETTAAFRIRRLGAGGQEDGGPDGVPAAAGQVRLVVERQGLEPTEDTRGLRLEKGG